MLRLPALLSALILSGLLSACADLQTRSDPPGSGQPSGGVLVPAVPMPLPTLAVSAPVVSAPSHQGAASAASSPSADEADQTAASAVAEPIIIRGNDRMVSPPSVPSNVPRTGGDTRLNFQGAPVAEVVRVVLHDLLQVDYVVHPPLDGTITLTTRDTVSADRALLLLETALQANGIVMGRDARGTYHVGSPDALKGIVSAPILAEPGKPLPPGYGAVIIPLQYLGAGEMARIMEPLIAPGAIVRIDTLRNILIMRGSRAEAEGWLDLVATFDVNLMRGMSVGVFPLKYTSATEIDAALRMLSGETEAGAVAAIRGDEAAAAAASGAPPRASRRAPVAPQSGAAQSALAGLGEKSPLFGALRIVPIERINAVLVITPRAAYLDEARYWIEQFDKPNLNSTEPQLFVYKVKNGSALHLAELLNGIYGGGPQDGGFSGATGVAPGLATTAGSSNVNTSFASRFGTRGNQSRALGNNFGTGFGGGFGGNQGGGFGGNQGGAFGNPGQGDQQQGPAVVTTQLGQSVRVMADQINNTLLVYANPAEYEQIANTLKRLDVQRAQVLIEASIVEVTLGDGLEYGLQWTFNNGVGGNRSGIGVIGNAGPDGNLLPTGGSAANAFTYTLRNAAGNISAVLTALANKSLIKIMSSPSLMVLDNHTAAIQVGTQQPVNTGTTISGTNNFQTTNIQYKDTGVMLGVTPSVTAGDLVTLDIDQIVTDVGPDSSSAATAGYPTFMQRQINSKVSVRSGETLVLGGLIKDSSSNSKAGLPILSSIPVIGALFGRHRDSAERTELLVILTPRVLRSDEDARAVSRELRDRMQGLLQGDSIFDAPASLSE